MAIIYTYPVKATPNDNDLILISDSEDSNKTKQVKISTLPGGSGSGVSSVTAVLPLASTGGGTPAISLTGLTGFGAAGQVIKVNSGADGLEWGAAGVTQIIAGTNVTIDPVSGVGSVTINASGGGGSLTVKDEGVDLTTSASSINFTGVGVTATTVGNDVTVNIPDAHVIEDVQLASAVSKGTALYISGPAHGSGRPTVDIADATNNTKMPVVGLALGNYSAGEGKMIVTGVLDNVDTSNTNIPGGTLGNVIYVDNSGVDNNLTGTKPTGTDLIQNVGIITKSGANGSIQVSCIGRTNDLPNLPENNIWLGDSNGVPSMVSNSLDNLSDVSFTATANGSLYVGQISTSITGTPVGNVTLGGGVAKNATTAFDNTLIGSDAAFAITEGNANVAIGSDVAATLTTGTNNVIIGDSANIAGATLSSTTVVGQGASGAADSTVVGKGATASTNGIAIGSGATAAGGGIAIGKDASAAANEIELNGITSSIVGQVGSSNNGQLKITINGTVHYIQLLAP